jgi:hypothetical protein
MKVEISLDWVIDCDIECVIYEGTVYNTGLGTFKGKWEWGWLVNVLIVAIESLTNLT